MVGQPFRTRSSSWTDSYLFGVGHSRTPKVIQRGIQVCGLHRSGGGLKQFAPAYARLPRDKVQEPHSQRLRFRRGFRLGFGGTEDDPSGSAAVFPHCQSRP